MEISVIIFFLFFFSRTEISIRPQTWQNQNTWFKVLLINPQEGAAGLQKNSKPWGQQLLQCASLAAGIGLRTSHLEDPAESI